MGISLPERVRATVVDFEGDAMAEQQKHILIVDDDVELADLLAQAIGDMSESYQVRAAQDVDEAMVLVHKFQSLQRAFHLVITDVKMTGLSGLELLELLNSIAPQTKTVVMTAYNSAELAERVQALDVYAYLTKPFVLSEFRRIVQSALASSALPEPEVTASPELSDAQRAALSRRLASLRSMTGSSAALLVHITGTTSVVDALESSTDIEDLSTELMAAQQRVAQQMGKVLSTDLKIKQSYFGAESHSICAYRLNPSYFVALIFGPAVKEGQIWYYMRDAVEGLASALEAGTRSPATAGQDQAGDVFDMLNRFFPDQPVVRPGRRRAAAAEVATETLSVVPETEAGEAGQASPVLSFEQAKRLGLIDADALGISTEDTPSQGADRPGQAGDAPSTSQVSLDEIDWGTSTNVDWDALVSETTPEFEGMTLKQAQQQGLVGPEFSRMRSQDTEAAQEATPATERPSLEEIDWDVAPDIDWEAIVSQADQDNGDGVDE
jgi:DNA-binding response OmpR family regulator